ncbi:hypothetical protein JCGZ_09820 [Jatropha curcas]|uniref:NET domain-containing protein n=2 Tax=Jatropha curcas TaxID=180498 RepID=A0A067KVI4_JATCU|nr:uncharacterized protein LOC105635720 isoform X2 [Jatropha curcas]XP_037493779.1 uncharacterized protein LOC105635720 isoform X2 [Jatropha curcas]KDP36255.1 hypothetical protein JCGZ_09820 [Jatropha curcas]
MSKNSEGLVASDDLSKVGPDYFTFYACEIKELLSQNEDCLPLATESTRNGCEKVRAQVKIEPSSSFFHNSVGAGLSDYKKERLNSSLRQTLAVLAPQVDEMLEPVVAMRKLQTEVRSRKLFSGHKGTESEGKMRQKNPDKRIKMSSSSSTTIATPTSPISSGTCKEFQCNANKNENESHFGSNTSSGKGDREGDGDLQFLLENDSSLVEETIKKYSDQLLTTLGHMEKQLEEILDTVVSTCRPMTLTEKQQLRKLIQKLPPKNYNRVVEIVQRSKPVDTHQSDEIFIDLEQQENATLWRLYYYVEAVDKARKLSS